MRAFLVEMTVLSLLRLASDLIAPEGDIHKYVDLGVGLLMLLSMLRGLISFIRGGL